MDRLRAKELAPIVKAYGDGEDIQFRWTETGWTDVVDSTDFCDTNINECEYRIKPKPREFFIPVKTKNGTHLPLSGSDAFNDGWIKVREVIE